MLFHRLLHYSCCPSFNTFLPLWIMSFQPERLFIPIHFSFLWRFSWAEASTEGSSSVLLFSLLGYVWEYVGQQIGFRCNVIIIDLLVAKEADRWPSKINLCLGAAAGTGRQEVMLVLCSKLYSSFTFRCLKVFQGQIKSILNSIF